MSDIDPRLRELKRRDKAEWKEMRTVANAQMKQALRKWIVSDDEFEARERAGLSNLNFIKLSDVQKAGRDWRRNDSKAR